MFASKHVVFVGPGRLPKELREVLAQRQKSPQPDLVVHVPRLLSFFDSAIEAERVAGQVQRLRLGVAAGGPEQPPAEAGWAMVEAFTAEGTAFTLTAAGGLYRQLGGKAISHLTVLDWRPPVGAPDRGMLVRLGGQETTFFLRASRLAGEEPLIAVLARMAALVEAFEKEAPLTARYRHRRFSPEQVGAPTLEGDLLPLGLAVVDLVDTADAERAPPEGALAATGPRDLEPVKPLQASLAWGWYAASLVVGAAGLSSLALSLASFELPAALVSSGWLVWAWRRLGWARWAAGEKVPVPSLPGPAPITPTALGPAVDVGLFAAALSVIPATPLGWVMAPATVVLGLAPLASGATLVEKKRRLSVTPPGPEGPASSGDEPDS